MKKILIAMVRGYQKWISPIFPPSCRFQPTCSNYMIQAAKESNSFEIGLKMEKV